MGRPSFEDVSELLMRLIAKGVGAEQLDELYTVIEQAPGSVEFPAEEGRDALLVAVAYLVSGLADYRATLEDGREDLALEKMRHLVAHAHRMAVLCDFLHRSGEKALHLIESGVSPFAMPFYKGRARDRGH